MNPILILGILFLLLRGKKGGRGAVDDSAREDWLPASLPAPSAHYEPLVQEVYQKPYVWGEEGPDAFDCSGLTYYKEHFDGNPVPRLGANDYRLAARPGSGRIKAGAILFYGAPGGTTTHNAFAASDEDENGRLLVVSASGTKKAGGSVKLYDRANYRGDLQGHGYLS